MAKRKALSSRTRFEVFKRDGFKCQYCGATPPKVLLHVDHIVAVANGGGNNGDNLITSCQPCNLGKAAVPLTCIPQSLKDKAAEVAEREAQILGYNEILQAKHDRIEAQAWNIAAILERTEHIDSYDRAGFQSIKTFLQRLPYFHVVDAAEITAAKFPYKGMQPFRYFCGVCWARIKESNAAR